MTNINANRSPSLSTKILLMIFSGSCLVFGLGWLYFKIHFQKEIENQVRQRAEIIANSVDQFAWINGISPSLQRLITAIGGEKAVGVVAIIRQNPFDVITASGSYVGVNYNKPQDFTRDFNDSVKLLDGLKSGKTISGIFKNSKVNDVDFIQIIPSQIKDAESSKIIPVSIYVQLEIEEQLSDINDDIFKVTLGFLIGLVGLTMLKYLVLQYYVFKPINLIKQTINMRSRGDYSSFVMNLNNDEIGDVGKALNVMLGQQEENKREITKQSNLLNTVIENIPLSLFAKNVQDNYRWVIWNKKAQETFDLTSEQVLGKVDYDMFPKEEADFFRATDIKVIEGGQIIDIPEEPVTTKRGTWPAHTIKVPVYDENNRPSLLVGILEDISDRKNREKELEKAIEDVLTANKLKSEFLSNISHELRTPMHSIITFSRQGIERVNKWSIEEQLENLKLIHDSGSRLMLLLNDLLDISKLEAGAVSYNIKKNDINALIQSVIRTLNPLADDKKLKVNYLNSNISYASECDSEKITQVLINLISNSIKFTPKESKVEIETTYSEEFDGSILISISDEGIGIPDDELEKVFDKFVQSSKTKTGAGGTGLGLAICKEIVLGHNGKIWAENKITGGARFNVLLPIKSKHGEENDRT